MKIDKLDQKLILDLQKDGRRHYMDLAKMLGVTEGTVRNRLRRLVGEGIIKITAVPALDKLGYSFMGIVGMQVRLADLRAVAEELAQNQNICYLANVTGRYEFVAIVLTRSPGEFAHFMENVISAIPSIVRTETFVTLNIYKGHGNMLDTTQLISNLDISSAEKR
ncbi:MAG: Lrp/AsnC family transcriptional regulator [Dehalococcoidales bacterium]